MNKKTKIIIAIVIGLIVLVGLGFYINRWYHTRISPDTPQTESCDCPSDKPIKGNSQSGIYHLPSGQYYDQTCAERCFSTEEEARDAGYRESKR